MLAGVSVVALIAVASNTDDPRELANLHYRTLGPGNRPGLLIIGTTQPTPRQTHQIRHRSNRPIAAEVADAARLQRLQPTLCFTDLTRAATAVASCDGPSAPAFLQFWSYCFSRRAICLPAVSLVRSSEVEKIDTRDIKNLVTNSFEILVELV